VAAYRCIVLRRTGGLAGMALDVRVDLDAAEPGSAELAGLLGALDVPALARRTPSAPAVPDAYHYDVTLVGEGGRQELHFGSGGVPPELRPVIRLLERRALDELRARRRDRG
jgi:hypothetical protein